MSQSNRNNQNNRSIQNTQSNQSNRKLPNVQERQDGSLLFLPQHGHYRHLRVYRVTEALYDITYIFCQRFLPQHGDRTVDQMIQAARSGKQNIAEGNQAAATSSETEIKLTNVARASLEELLVDYEDYLRTRSLPQWELTHPRLSSLRQWTRSEDFYRQYEAFAKRMRDEELANLGISLCHQAIYMLGQLLKTQQERFTEQGGIKERMHTARTGYREKQDNEMAILRQQNASLLQENTVLRKQVCLLEERIKELSNWSSQSNQSTRVFRVLRVLPRNKKQ